MEFNPSKCEFLRITNKMNPTVYNYHIEATPIVQVEHTKYLGVTISSNLSWNEHVQRITNKAKQVNNFLYRNLWKCPTHIKSGCYKIMVRPVTEYAASVWDPYTLSNINKLESIQRTAARFCFNNFSRFLSVTNMLTSLNLPPLQARRTHSVCSELSGEKITKHVNRLLAMPEEKWQKLWNSKPFKAGAVKYSSNWVAIQKSALILEPLYYQLIMLGSLVYWENLIKRRQQLVATSYPSITSQWI